MDRTGFEPVTFRTIQALLQRSLSTEATATLN